MSQTPRALLFAFDALILSSWPSARPTGPARSPGCAGRSPRPGSSASIASDGGSAPAEWGRSTWPSTSS